MAIALNAAALRCSIAAAQPTAAPPAAVAINDFGLRLLRNLSAGARTNVIVSPLSVCVALAMAYNGAAGATRTAMARTLGLTRLSDDDFNRAIRSALDTVQTADPAVRIEIANALWPRAGLPIDPDFLKLSRAVFGAAPISLDFGSPQAAARINAWVKARTAGKIPAIVNALPPSTALVLTDVVYFKGRWQVPFDPKLTKLESFHLAGGGAVKAPMMVREGDFDYLETDSFQAIRLPYGNGRLAMAVFLPRRSAGLPDFLRSLDQAHLSRWMAGIHPRKGRLVMPRLESRYGQRLNDALIALGMGVAFGPQADFSRIHPPPPPIRIDDVEHKTYLKVDEQGTEAAAATSIGFAATMLNRTPPPFEMVVDHPFFCAIIERRTSMLLFAGIVTNPTSD